MRTGKWGEGDGRQFLKVGTGSLLPTWGQNLQQDSHHPNQPAFAAFVPLPFRNVVWAGAVLIIHITVGTFGTHKAVQSYSKFPVPATAFCIVIQDGACPRGWCRTHVPGQTCWEAQAFCPPSPTVTVNQMFIILFCRRAGPGHSFTRMLRVLAVWANPPSSVIWHSRLVVVWSHTRKEGCMRSLSAAPVRKKSWRQAKMLERSLMSHAVALQEWLHMPARLQLPWFLRVLSWLAYTVWHQA